jgi:hypothetical protein
MDNHGVGGSNGNNGNHAEDNNNSIHEQVGTRTTSRMIPRPVFISFLGGATNRNT